MRCLSPSPCRRLLPVNILIWVIIFAGGSAVAAPKNTLKADYGWAESQLKEKKYSPEFLRQLKMTYDRKSFSQVLNLNILGFLSPPQHMKLVSDEAVRKSGQFIDSHGESFQRAEKEYGVPPKVISSLLWIETRHGALTGRFHVPSVYLHLMQGPRPQNQDALLKIAIKKNRKDKRFTTVELRERIRERTEKRAQWAAEQIEALAFIYEKKMKDLRKLKGSFAGAFGLPQFIPSSYRIWASSGTAQAAPDLFSPEDAILSVGNYLKVHGWKADDRSAQLESLMKYNQSRDYAESILEIARRLDSRQAGIDRSDSRP